MREIKFRAWSEPLKLMQEPFGLVSDLGMLGCQGEIHKEPYVLSQYTGLKDKNGVDIYEGGHRRGDLLV